MQNLIWRRVMNKTSYIVSTVLGIGVLVWSTQSQADGRIGIGYVDHPVKILIGNSGRHHNRHFDRHYRRDYGHFRHDYRYRPHYNKRHFGNKYGRYNNRYRNHNYRRDYRRINRHYYRNNYGYGRSNRYCPRY